MSTGSLHVGLDEIVGREGNGTFTQSIGSHTIDGNLILAQNTAGKTGTFKMSSGSLSVGGNEIIGNTGIGDFTQSSGSHKITGNLTLADLAGSTGTYTMKSGSLNVTGDEVIGNNGPATFTQSSGSNSAKTISLAKNAPATYNLNGGSVSASSPALDAIHINGPYDNNIPSAIGGNFNVTGKATVNGNVTNDGLVKTTNANVTWNGIFTNNSAYVSDPGSKQTFKKDLVVNSNGYLVGQAPLGGSYTPPVAGQPFAQDLFLVEGNLVNQSTLPNKWNTINAGLQFVSNGASTSHNFDIAGIDNGQPGHFHVGAPGNIAAANNFAWFDLNITGQTITLKDVGAAGGAQYVGLFIDDLANVDTVNHIVKNIIGDNTATLNIYYDPDIVDNAYLGDATYSFLSGNGQLIPYHTPLPPSVVFLGSGLLGMGLLGYRRKRG